MLKRLKMWMYVAVSVAGGMLFRGGGCGFGGGGGLWPYNGNAESVPRIIAAILREDLLG